jgi:hypothetical protein
VAAETESWFGVHGKATIDELADPLGPVGVPVEDEPGAEGEVCCELVPAGVGVIDVCGVRLGVRAALDGELSDPSSTRPVIKINPITAAVEAARISRRRQYTDGFWWPTG